MAHGSGQVYVTRCEALATSGDIDAAGSLRRVGEIRLSPLPSLAVPLFEASEGWWRTFGPGTGHIAVPESLATSLAPRLLEGTPVDVGPVTIDSYYRWSDDGRSGSPGLAVIARGVIGVADECWVRTTDPAADSPPLLHWAAVACHGAELAVTPLNPGQGRLTTILEFHNRVSRFAWLAAAVIVGGMATMAWRLRAVELALARAMMGVPRPAAVATAPAIVSCLRHDLEHHQRHSIR